MLSCSLGVMSQVGRPTALIVGAGPGGRLIVTTFWSRCYFSGKQMLLEEELE